MRKRETTAMRFGGLLIVFSACLALTVPLVSTAQEAVFMVRHAEQGSDGEDPPLTEAGRQRAVRLPSVLRDASIRVIYTSETRRTIQTAQPVATAFGVESRIVLRREIDALVGRLAAQHAQDRVLIVSHSQTIPVLLRALGHTGEVAIGRDEYDSLFVVIPRPGGPPVVLRLHF
jgi:broad specificity phosphatase PhoE